jgi:hypothetical protein
MMLRANVNKDIADLEEDKEMLKATQFNQHDDLVKTADVVSKGRDDLYSKFVQGKFISMNDKGR